MVNMVSNLTSKVSLTLMSSDKSQISRLKLSIGKIQFADMYLCKRSGRYFVRFFTVIETVVVVRKNSK